jgi:zinc protease
MIKKLDAAFARWPVPGENPGPPAAPSEAARSGWFVADKDVNQTRVSIGVRAIDRYDPDYYAAQIMNYIIGGGGFSSRLVNSIRSDEGLAYHVGSSIDGGVYYPDPWRIDFETKARSTARATELALDEIRRMAGEPVSPQELDAAKRSFIEGFPARFPSAGAIAGGLAADEVTGRYQRDPKSLAEYTQRVDAVTAADVQRVAKRLLDPSKMTFLFVGNASEMALTDGKHDVTLVKLAGRDLSKVPLRDPLTMKEQGTAE